MCTSLHRVLESVGKPAIGYSAAFDAGAETTCLCDQGFRGADCAQIECPSKADPMGGHGGNGKDRFGTAGPAKDCSGRGLCNYDAGLCTCFEGYSGTACERQTTFV